MLALLLMMRVSATLWEASSLFAKHHSTKKKTDMCVRISVSEPGGLFQNRLGMRIQISDRTPGLHHMSSRRHDRSGEVPRWQPLHHVAEVAWLSSGGGRP